MLLDPTDRMHGPLSHVVRKAGDESSRDSLLPVAAQIDPLIHDEWEHRLEERR